MKRSRKPLPPPVDLAAARKRAAALDERQEIAAGWVAQVRADARRLLAAGDAITSDLCRLLYEIGQARAAQEVQKALPAADAEAIQVERWCDFLRDDPGEDGRRYLETRAARGDRAARRALEIAKGRQ